MPFYNAINNTANFAISFSKIPKNDFSRFAKGYFKAAAKLTKAVLSQKHFSDNEAYPIVFLYRHSFELYIKNVIYSTALLSSFRGLSEIDMCLYNNHRLRPLSEIADKIMQKLFPNDRELVEILNKMINTAKDFDDIDRDSYSYRYPIDTAGNPSTKINQIVNLESFSQTMNELLNGLDEIDLAISIEKDKAQEIYEIIESIKTECNL